ncbi:MAG: hypothetical protein WA555_15575 [Candidatus Sulfotelmatobacter sp.]
MVALIAAQAEKIGTPLSEEERRFLLDESAPPLCVVAQESDAKFTKLIGQTFDSEVEPDDPKNLGNSTQWAGDRSYPRVVALTEQVILSRGEKFPQLRGRRRIIDLIQLVGCGFVVVILMMVVVALVSWLFGDK